MLKIDPEFADQIPPLTEEEYQQLEANILSDGEVINPIIIWNGVIVDGHNRFRILEQHPEIPYKTFEKKFSDRSEVIAWICKNQLGRRNLTADQRTYLIGKQYALEKQTDSFKGNQYTLGSESGGGQNDHHQKAGKAAERIARENHVSEKYVRRAEHYAKGVDAADEAVPGTRSEILSGKICPVHSAVQEVAQAPPEEREMLANHLRDPEVQRRGRKRPESHEDRIMRKIAEDMDKPGGQVSGTSMLDSIRGVAATMIRGSNRCFEMFPALLTERSYREQVIAIMQEPKNYIINLEAGGIPQ
ncbi:MAG: hypothetical protein LUC47_07515 [Clostridiales bacterium]|nr:hypothetical protein [Clostridiales bacterium]